MHHTPPHINHAKISNVKEENNKKRLHVECECTTHLHGKEVLNSLKERKSKVNKLLQNYSRCYLKTCPAMG
jgi:hypothetical protein